MAGEAPSRIGKYEIRGKLGKGAMGEVFRGHDPVLGRDVAIKVMSVGHADAELLQRFQREAQSAARLNHPNIITVFDFGDEDGKLYMAMELLEGHDVKDVMGKLSFEEKLGVMEQVAEGLAFAHAKQVVHRDLKPANIHVQPNGQIKILDFGLAKLGGSDMTRTGTVMGTPFYMSPEQVRGEKVDARSDIFSIGSVFYELLTDHKPFTAESMHAVLFQVLQNEPESVRTWAPEVPGILVEVVEKCLAKDAEQRFADGGQLRDAMTAVRSAIDGGRADSTSLAAEMPGAAQATVLERPRVARSTRGPGSSPRMAVAGATALQKAPGVEDQPTMVGAAGTVRGATTRTAGRTVRGDATEGASASRTPLYLGVGAVVLALGGAGFYFLLRPGPAPPGPAPIGNTNGALAQDLVATQLALAKRQLEDKDWSGAIGQAEKVLKVDPANAEAERVRDSARRAQADIEAAAGEARDAFASGRIDAASAALARLLALDPTHPTATELSTRLNSRFQVEAEDARRQMRSAQTEAQRAGASSVSSFAEATSLAHEADGFFGKGAFASAARQYLASKNAFGRAQREALRPSPPPTPVTTPVPTPPPTPLPTPTPAPPTPAPTPTPHPATPTPTPPPAADEEPAIRKVVADFGRAIESKDLALYKSLRPNLSAEDERKLRDAFAGSPAQQVSMSVGSIQIKGAEARVRVTRRDTFKGHRLDPVQQTLVLAKGPGGWTIREVAE